MEDEEDLTPSGSDVVSTGVTGLGTFGQALGGLFITGLSRAIDLEFAEREQIIDSATQASLRNDQFGEPGLRDVVDNLTTAQIAGLWIAAALTVALLTGAFR